jgi:hypothetical protein
MHSNPVHAGRSLPADVKAHVDDALRRELEAVSAPEPPQPLQLKKEWFLKGAWGLLFVSYNSVRVTCPPHSPRCPQCGGVLQRCCCHCCCCCGCFDVLSLC